jgi:DNA-binding response OmpR family regulator
MSQFNDLSVLLVEDEYLIALDAEQILKDFGVGNVEIAATLDHAAKCAENGKFDVAVLDVNINGQFSYPIAEAFGRRGVPVVFATGYQLRDNPPSGFDPGVCVTKPYTPERLREALSLALSQRVAKG